jgi:hypothetical protein
MFDEIVTNLSGLPLIVLAVVFFFAGRTARRSSPPAAAHTPLVASLIFAALVFVGVSERNVSFADFLQTEIVNLVLLAVTIYGFCSMAIRYGLPAYQSTVVEPKKRSEQERREREQQRQREKTLAENRKRDEERQRQFEAERPERERLEREKKEQERQLADKIKREAERREQARAKTLLAYHRHAGEIGESFPWERFCEFTEKYMNDSLPADKVEVSAEQLIDMISSFFEPEKPVLTKRTPKEIHDQFENERQQILSLGYGAEDTASALAQLAWREQQALKEGC